MGLLYEVKELKKRNKDLNGMREEDENMISVLTKRENAYRNMINQNTASIMEKYREYVDTLDLDNLSLDETLCNLEPLSTTTLGKLHLEKINLDDYYMGVLYTNAKFIYVNFDSIRKNMQNENTLLYVNHQGKEFNGKIVVYHSEDMGEDYIKYFGLLITGDKCYTCSCNSKYGYVYNLEEEVDINKWYEDLNVNIDKGVLR